MKKTILVVTLVLLTVCFAEKMTVSGNVVYVDIDDSISASEWQTKQLACYIASEGLKGGVSVVFHTRTQEVSYFKADGRSAWLSNGEVREDITLEQVGSWIESWGKAGYNTDCARLALKYIDVLD